jgi:hypothetical protein
MPSVSTGVIAERVAASEDRWDTVAEPSERTFGRDDCAALERLAAAWRIALPRSIGFTGALEEALECACVPYLSGPTAWSQDH